MCCPWLAMHSSMRCAKLQKKNNYVSRLYGHPVFNLISHCIVRRYLTVRLFEPRVIKFSKSYVIHFQLLLLIIQKLHSQCDTQFSIISNLQNSPGCTTKPLGKLVSVRHFLWCSFKQLMVSFKQLMVSFKQSPTPRVLRDVPLTGMWPALSYLFSGAAYVLNLFWGLRAFLSLDGLHEAPLATDMRNFFNVSVLASRLLSLYRMKALATDTWRKCQKIYNHHVWLFLSIS
jgi:hypothetical protein